MGVEEGELWEEPTISIPEIKELKMVWPNFKVSDQRFNWLPDDVSLKISNAKERLKQIPYRHLKTRCKYGGDCTNIDKCKLAIMAVLDIRGGKERFINKTKTPKITISDFAVLVCCGKMFKYLKSVKNEAKKLKIPFTHNNIKCESNDMIRGRRFDQLLTLHHSRITSIWAMEAVSLMIMKL